MSHPNHSGEAITILKVDPILDTGIAVSSTAQGADGWLDPRCSAYHDNRSPPLRWSNVPDVRSWALVVEDPDAPREQPFIHWMIWNIPGELHGLPEALPNNPELVTPQGAVQGRNGMGGHGYFGPRPPPGHGIHRYYFQVFALDDRLEMGPDSELRDLLNALKGRTLAKGEMVALFEAPTAQ